VDYNARVQTCSIVVPAFNEARGLPTVLDELARACPAAEIIVVDDGSTDDTAGTARRFPVVVVSHGTNRGYGAALKTGIAHAKHDSLVFCDADGQHDPAHIPPMLDALERVDLVIGERKSYSRRSPLHWLGRRLLTQLIRFLTRVRLRDINCGLRAVRRPLIQRYVNLLPDGFSFSTTSTVVFAKFGHRLEFVPIEVRRRIGASSVRLLRDGYNTLLLVIRLVALFDPLRVFVPPAFTLVILGVLYGVFKYMTLPVYTGLSGGALSMFLTGVMVFLLGVVCDQIASLRLERYRDDR
jgi:glycosyltransferase involved in cell wall biosynthesis